MARLLERETRASEVPRIPECRRAIMPTLSRNARVVAPYRAIIMDTRWISVASFDDLAEEGTLAVEAAGEEICLYRIGGQVYATHDICTHEEASLASGYIDGDCIECPLHQARF